MKDDFVSLEKQELEAEPDMDALARAERLDDSDAEAEYKVLAEKGSIRSMVNLGRLYEDRGDNAGGEGFAESEFWYKRAVALGSAVATLYCGSFYFRRGSYDKAREVFSIGAERGYAPSIVRLANLYLKGIGVDRDYDRARRLLKQASELGNLWAKLAIAAMTVTLGDSTLTKLKGLLMGGVAAVQFRIQKWRDPYSERLRK